MSMDTSTAVAPLLQLVDASVTFSGSSQPAVSSVSLSLQAGDAVGIVGESGSGKTTIGRLMVGALRPTCGLSTVAGRKWSEVARTDQLRRSVQMVFQNPFSSLNPWMTPRQTIAEVLRHWFKTSGKTANVQAEELLREVGLDADALDRLPHTLSGGQCQRVGIARALACQPDCLIADEPTSALDVSVQAQILNLLASLRAKRSIALVLISHDLTVVRHATDQVVVLLNGSVVETGATEAVFTEPQHAYTRDLIAAAPVVAWKQTH
jgi:ABC-type glutathione transport system ATPase component